MKNLYLDTNIIISFIKDDDIFNDFSTKIMAHKNFERIGSAITILEIVSVISKQFENIEISVAKIADWDKLSESEKKLLVTSYIISTIPMKFYFSTNNERFNIKNDYLDVNVDYSKAIKIAPFFNLRTLDNLQIASALNIRDIKNIRVDYFVTTDQIILDNSKKIQKLLGITIINSEKLIDIENL
ncbi:MAG: PIN domain-containing protein [Candidatus Helarchaeota archaeon]